MELLEVLSTAYPRLLPQMYLYFLKFWQLCLDIVVRANRHLQHCRAPELTEDFAGELHFKCFMKHYIRMTILTLDSKQKPIDCSIRYQYWLLPEDLAVCPEIFSPSRLGLST